jgi:membrane protein DedA with SNARE-associated domain
MPRELINYIIQYGYLFIFLLVFLQEIGVPSFPNELMLIYFGYLVHQGMLNIFCVVAIAVAADVSGTFVLYILFYFFSAFIIKHKPSWLHIPYKTIHSIKQKISNGGNWKIFTGRLIPYLRGYTSVVAGLLRINTARYGIMILLSALIWSAGYIMIGWFAAPYWQLLSKKIGVLSNFMMVVPVALILFFTIKYFMKKYALKNN